MKIKEYYASKNKKIKLCIENFKTILAFEIFYKLLGFFILLPIVKEIFKFTLRIMGLKIIIQNNILEYISKPIIYPFLLLIVMIAGVYVYFEIISFVNITLYIMKNRCISLLELLEVNIKTLKQQAKPINIFLWVYILLLLPLSFSFLENYLIVNFAFPSFVLDYFQHNLPLFFFVLVFLLICFWFTWIWCFVFHFMILKDMNFLEARKASSLLWKKNKGKFFKKSFLVFLISFISKYTIGVWQYACGYIVYKMRADANLLTLYLITLVYIFINLCIKIALNIFVFYELSDFYYEYNPVQKMPKKLKNNKFVGDYSYYDDPVNSENFENNVLYHYPFIGDKLIIGKFCAIARDVKFIMNGANHKMNCFTTYPFSIFRNGWEKVTPEMEALPIKSNTVMC